MVAKNPGAFRPFSLKPWRIAFPLAAGGLAEQLFSAKSFAFYVASTLSGKIFPEDEIPVPENRLDLWPLWLADNLVDAVVVRDIPARLRTGLQDLGIVVYCVEQGLPDTADLMDLARACYLEYGQATESMVAA